VTLVIKFRQRISSLATPRRVDLDVGLCAVFVVFFKQTFPVNHAGFNHSDIKTASCKSIRMMRNRFWMVLPATSWTLRGKANVFSRLSASGADASVAPGAARRDALALKTMIEDVGGTVAVLHDGDDTHPELTGFPYCAEAGHAGIDDDGPFFFLPNLVPPHRRPETDVIEATLQARGVRTKRLPHDVAWEGQGDVIRIDATRAVCTAGVGPAARTAATSYVHVANILPFQETLFLPFIADPFFHGNTFLASFEGTERKVVFVCRDALFAGDDVKLQSFCGAATEFVWLSREDAMQYPTNALQVENHVLYSSSHCERYVDVWRSVGLTPVHVPLPTLFGRGGGAAVCLTQRIDVAGL
jgi:N-dimethylarginine dimethylaminohydrolase